MESINMLRTILVAGAVVAAGFAAAASRWLVVAILLIGIAAHGLMWVHLHRSQQQRDLPGYVPEGRSNRVQGS